MQEGGPPAHSLFCRSWETYNSIMSRKQLFVILSAVAWIAFAVWYQLTDDSLSIGLMFGLSWKLGLAFAMCAPALIAGPVAYYWVGRSAKV
jgi:hypothetical protein